MVDLRCITQQQVLFKVLVFQTGNADEEDEEEIKANVVRVGVVVTQLRLEVNQGSLERRRGETGRHTPL
ncbi:unnamed protein product [Arctogadus glacialis]